MYSSMRAIIFRGSAFLTLLQTIKSKVLTIGLLAGPSLLFDGIVSVYTHWHYRDTSERKFTAKFVMTETVYSG